MRSCRYALAFDRRQCTPICCQFLCCSCWSSHAEWSVHAPSVNNKQQAQQLRYQEAATSLFSACSSACLFELGMYVSACRQVWYSSSWSISTLEASRRAVTDLLTIANSLGKLPPQRRVDAQPSAGALSSPDVLELLRHWQVKNVTLAAARSAWLDNADNAFGHIVNFKRKADRLALSELALTGEMRALGSGDTGSVVMSRQIRRACI